MAAKKIQHPSIEDITGEFKPASEEIEFFRTGVYAIDLLTGGRGLPFGSVVHLYSESLSGKTTMIKHMAKNLLLRGFSVVDADVEKGGHELTTDLGLDKMEKYHYVQPIHYNNLAKTTDAFVHSMDSPALLIVDSLTAVTVSPETFYQKTFEEAVVNFYDSKMTTQYLRYYRNFLINQKKTIFFITQTRANIVMEGGWKAKNAPKVKAAGGKAVEFLPDLRIWIEITKTIKEDDILHNGSEAIFANSGYLKAEKTRFTHPHVKIPILIIMGKGVSNTELLKKYLKFRGIASQRSSYIKIALPGREEVTVQGIAKYDELLRSPEYRQLFEEDFYMHATEYFDYLKNDPSAWNK